jgi:hypothetical protein
MKKSSIALFIAVVISAGCGNDSAYVVEMKLCRIHTVSHNTAFEGLNLN